MEENLPISPSAHLLDSARRDVNTRVLTILNCLLRRDCELNGENAILVRSLRMDVRDSLAEYTWDDDLKKKLTSSDTKQELLPEQIIDRLIEIIKDISPDLSEHHENVAKLAFLMGTILEKTPSVFTNYDKETALKTEYSAYVHDIGKLDARIATIIAQNKMLELPEKLVVAYHARIGAIVLKHLGLPKEVTDVADFHHITLPHSPRNQSYPVSSLPVAVCLTTVADSVDAMTSSRPGNCIKTIGYVLSELEDGVSDELEDGVSWGKYDKAAVTAFSSICAELGYDKTSEEFVTVKELLKKYNGKLEGKVACA